MSIFPNIDVEQTVQVNDRVRISASRSFVSKEEGAVTGVLIKPESSEDFITVTGSSSDDWYLDWEYSASGTKTITCNVSNSGGSAQITASVTVVTSSADYLFSSDDDLKISEPDIMKWLPDGKNSYKNIHRKAQDEILKWLRKEGFVDIDGEPFTKTAIVDIEEVRNWSKFMVLRLIFEGISNAVDDVFDKKAKKYKGYEVEWRNQSKLKLDVDGDGEADDAEGVDLNVGFVARR